MEVKIGGTWVPLKRSSNNQWPYYNTNGPWESSFPMPIRVTSAVGETIEDSVPSSKGGEGTKQFSAVSSVCIWALLLRMPTAGMRAHVSLISTASYVGAF